MTPVLCSLSKQPDLMVYNSNRESYNWLKHNTPEDAKVMSWWDYGYQLTAMANRYGNLANLLI